jgi:predicted glutamine amidotransferase
MCRLLGWAARSPRSLSDLLGEADLADFTALSRIHGDGWGVAWGSGDGLDVHTNTEAAYATPEFGDWAHAERHDLGMVHLRWATLGLPVEPANTHPFAGPGPDGTPMAFAHNGSVRPPEALDPLLTAGQRAAMVGTTDSERYFRAVLSAAESVPLEQALAGTVTTIAETMDFTSLNCLLLTPDTLYAACRFDPAQKDQGEDYFHLRYRVTDDAVVVASTGWGRDWQPLENGQLLVVRRNTLETSVVSLEDVLIPS